MKKILKYIALLAGAVIAFGACTDDNSDIAANNSVEEEKEVVLKLDYGAISPTIIVSRSEATAEEKALHNLYIYVFSDNGKLKGFAKVEDLSQLKQDGSVGTVSVSTTTGASYIYAVANYRKENAVYSINGLPIDINPTDAQSGVANDIDLDGFKSLIFTRASGELLVNEYLMTGSANGGESCVIGESNGVGVITSPTTDDDKLIKLHRVVSKVQFNIKAGANVEFTPTKYDIVNIPIKGSVVKGQSVSGNTFESSRDNVFGTQSLNTFEVKLPENLQTMKQSVSSWHEREANTYSNDEIAFTNAPTDGTYVILYGKFKDPAKKIEGDTHYYIHLGDCSANNDDYNNERNCRYIYNVTVTNVDKIIVEATKDEAEQPGAEGFIMDYNAGKVFTLDSHYEYCVLRFSQEAIKQIKKASNGKRGYVYQVKALGKETDIINVASAEDTAYVENKLHGVDIDWIKFAKNEEVSDYQESDNVHGGTPVSYTKTKEYTYGNSQKKGELLTINALLLYLYDIAELDNKWNNGYLTFTGYVKENYYQRLSWEKYTNVAPRVMYIADEVWTSSDKKSTYAKVAYAVSQYAIQTFYDRSKASTLIAYGCETINDEKGKKGIIQENNPVSMDNREDEHDKLAGRQNMKADFGWTESTKWEEMNYSDLRAACMSRNRDLNRNGVIDDNEIRWYTATVAQYTGLWIGEEALGNTEARLFTNQMSDVSGITDPDIMHYYTSTYGARTYWAEEGMAYGNQGGNQGCKYVRCVRTLKSNDGESEVDDTGYKLTPHVFYELKEDDRVISLEGLVDEKALRVGTLMEGELPQHLERINAAFPDPYNKPRIQFLLAERRVGEVWGINNYSWDWSGNAQSFTINYIKTGTPCATYGQEGNQNGGLDDLGHWRAPNQREFCLIELKKQAQTMDAARTGYTGTYRVGYHKNNEVNMISTDNLNTKNLTVRCVRDYNKMVPIKPVAPELVIKEIMVTKQVTFYYRRNYRDNYVTSNLGISLSPSNNNIIINSVYNDKWAITIRYKSNVDISGTNLVFSYSSNNTYKKTVPLSEFINSETKTFQLTR